MKKIFFLIFIFSNILFSFCLNAQINESDTVSFQAKTTLSLASQTGNVEMLTGRGKFELLAFGNKKIVFKTQNSYLYQEFFKRKADEDVFSRNFVYFNPKNRVYPFAIGFVSSNFRREIDFRYFAGVGITFQMVKKEKHLIKTALSGVYEETRFKKNIFNDDFYTQIGSNSIGTTRATFWLFGKHFFHHKKIILHYDAYLQPSVQRIENIRGQIDAGVDFLLSKNFSFTTNFLYLYENVVIFNQKTEDTFLTFGFSYKI